MLVCHLYDCVLKSLNKTCHCYWLVWLFIQGLVRTTSVQRPLDEAYTYEDNGIQLYSIITQYGMVRSTVYIGIAIITVALVWPETSSL